jgi:hypothetical protein
LCCKCGEREIRRLEEVISALAERFTGYQPSGKGKESLNSVHDLKKLEV